MSSADTGRSSVNGSWGLKGGYLANDDSSNALMRSGASSSSTWVFLMVEVEVDSRNSGKDESVTMSVDVSSYGGRGLLSLTSGLSSFNCVELVTIVRSK